MESSLKSILKKKSMVEENRSRTPSSACSEEEEEFVRSEHDSDVVEKTPENTPEKALRKRSRSAQESESDGSSEDAIPAPKMPTARRGRGRPPTHGKYVGLGQARAELAAALRKADDEERTSEEDALIDAAARRVAAGRKQLAVEPDAEDLPVSLLKTRLSDALEAIRLVSKKSKGLKGTCQKSLKVSIEAIRDIADAVFSRTENEEVVKLQKENARLAKELAELKQRQEAFEKRQEQGTSKTESELVALVRQELGEFRAKLSVMEGRLLRPPLAADRARVPPPPSPPMPVPQTSYAAKVKSSRPPVTSPAADTGAPASLKGRQRKQKAKQPASVAPKERPAAPVEQPAASSRKADDWEVVGRKKEEAKKRKKAAKKAKQAAKKAARKLQAPRSTAVVLTLQPAAIERGTTYAELLKKARTAIDPGKLGITSGLRCRTTQTGARLIEVPGVASGDQADRLAESLRQVLEAEEVRVSRPQKCIDLRITGLDDSVTKEEVVAAVTKTGGCPAEHIKCGEIKQGRAGMGTAIVSCPVAAAKKLADGRRLLVGWVSAQVKALDPRPARCYRCLSSGHVGVRCPSQADCTGRCFRCGRPGHMAATCEATPHCVLCAAAGKPAEHRAGGRGCAATNKKLPPRPPALSSAATKVAAPAVGGAEVSMET